MPRTALSLFSGAGGLDLGFEQAGFEVALAVDVDAHAVRTYATNRGMPVGGCGEPKPRTAVHCDVRRMSLKPLRGRIDVLLGGPPCQDYSIVRGPRAAGIATEGGSLVLEFARALTEAGPRVFVFENVPNMARLHGGSDYRAFMNAVRRAGYRIAFAGTLNAVGAGVPQARARLFVVGVREGEGIDAEALGEAVRAAASDPVLAKYPLTAMEAFEGGTLDELAEKYREVMGEWRGVWREVATPAAERWFREVWSRLTMDPVQDYLVVNGITPTSEGEVREALRRHREVLEELGYLGRPVCRVAPPDGSCEEPKVSREVRERMRLIPPGENYRFVVGTPWGVNGRGISLIYRRLHPLKPAYTVVGRGGGGTWGYHYGRGRAALSIRELARLQSFPDEYLFPVPRWRARALIGDAVPVLLAKRVAEAVGRVLK